MSRRLAAAFRFLFRAKRLQVALLAAHHVEPRFVAAKLGAERQFLGERIQRQMLLDRGALLEGAAGGHHEGGARKRGQDDRDSIGPVGDRGDSHPATVPAAV
jgi:hypothetical protein